MTPRFLSRPLDPSTPRPLELDEVAEFTTTQETLTFSLPQTLKRDMRAAEQKRAAAVAASLAEPA